MPALDRIACVKFGVSRLSMICIFSYKNPINYEKRSFQDIKYTYFGGSVFQKGRKVLKKGGGVRRKTIDDRR